ncbi:lamin tail domain-containing protein [Haloarcula sp. 1CSR25-25]|uniref:lamin tail domain-containing protein n=1 Tax=Haloarcula sp. 1CSR25-25 TaxID=2862545 RepID=UPI002895849E|nr:lamin tail domain-containing protein [Haloarcula sp. 1CSR25-25]MDT3433270.1 lamin tail domain-containing protein [Haloarcula sp. 1CSR25-25]
MSSSRGLTILLFAVVLLLAGCSGSAPADVSTPDPTPTATAAETTTAANGTVEVHYINVGQSVSTLVVGPTGETMLIDTGHFTDDGEYVLQYLQRHDIDRIDHLVVSHNDADHIGGNAAIIEYYETEADGIGIIYDPGIAASTKTYERYLDAVEEHDVTLYETREGDSIQFEGVDTQVLGPPEPYLENDARNENSIVLKLTHGETSFLLTGDAEDDQEGYLVDEYGNQLQATVMKAGHHGSSSSTSGDLLDAVQPKAVIISSAYDSQYGHPTEEVLQRLHDRSMPTYWTATHGDIVLVSDGAGVSVRTQQAAPTDPLAIRDGKPVEPGTTGDVVERDRLGASPVTTQTEAVATDGGMTGTADSLQIAAINADAEGDDRENLNDEYVVFENTGDEPLDLSGWTVEDDVGKTYTFPDGYTLGAGETVTLHTGSGTDSDTDLYWDSGSPIWNNGGDTVTVRNSDGDVVRQRTYE